MTVDEKLERITEYLDEYEKQCGFPDTFNLNTINRATELMNTDFSEFRMTPEECHEASLILSTYANNLQRVINRDRAQKYWATEEIKKITVPNLKRQTAYNFEERMSAATAENEVAMRLLKHKMDAELRLLHTESMYFSIKNIADKFTDMGKSLSFRRN